MNKSSIEWTNYTSNPIQAYSPDDEGVLQRGWYCEKVSRACKNCYAETLNLMRGNGVAFAPKNRDRITFRLNESELAEWSRKRLTGPEKGQSFHTGRCFAFDMTDVFAEWVPDEWLEKIFSAIGHAPNLDFQILTKRPERMSAFIRGAFARGFDTWPLPNLWLGVTAETQADVDERIPILLDTPAAVRFVSAEPLLGPVDLRRYVTVNGNGRYGRLYDYMAVNWIIVGGESGPKHRPFNPDWAREVVSLCADSGTACFVKQLGGARPGNRLEDLPEDLRVRQFPR